MEQRMTDVISEDIEIRPKSRARRRWIGGFCALVLAIGNPLERAQASELDDLLGAEAHHAVSNEDLETQRGGFVNANGVLVNFGLDISTRVNGAVQRTTKIVFDSVAKAQQTVESKTKKITVPTTTVTTNANASPTTTSKAPESGALPTNVGTEVANTVIPAVTEIVLGVTDKGQIVVTENSNKPSGNVQTSSGLVKNPGTTNPEGTVTHFGESPAQTEVQDFASLQPGQIIDASTLTGLLTQQNTVVNDTNNTSIQQMRSLTVDIANFSEIHADAIRGMLGASLSSFVNTQVMLSLPR